MGVLAWAGCPVRSADGEVLGTFCAVSTQPRAWSSRDETLLCTLATASTAEQVSLAVAAFAPDALGAQFVNVHVTDASGTHMAVIRSPSVPAFIVDRYSTIRIDTTTAPGCAILRNEPAWAANITEYAAQWPEVAEDARSAHVESTMTQMCSAALEGGQVGDAHHGLVRALQDALLPPVPAIPALDVATWCIPANHHLGFGGDWYDVFAISDTLVAIVVGDVCGHGIAAAATMAHLRGSINALTRLKIDALPELFDVAEDWLVESPDFVATIAVHVVDLEASTDGLLEGTGAHGTKRLTPWPRSSSNIAVQWPA